MSQHETTLASKGVTKPIKAIAFGAAAMFAAAAATPATAHSFDFGDNDKELLEQLIELDAADIRELQTDLADARTEIRDAIGEIEEARLEVQSAPGGGAILRTALSAASKIASRKAGDAFEEVRSELDVAERDLVVREAEVGAAEFAETQGAIIMLREELVLIEAALSDLLAAMRA